MMFKSVTCLCFKQLIRVKDISYYKAWSYTLGYGTYCLFVNVAFKTKRRVAEFNVAFCPPLMSYFFRLMIFLGAPYYLWIEYTFISVKNCIRYYLFNSKVIDHPIIDLKWGLCASLMGVNFTYHQVKGLYDEETFQTHNWRTWLLVIHPLAK